VCPIPGARERTASSQLGRTVERDVVHRDAEAAAFVETNFADAALAFLDQTTMAARETAQRVPVQMLGQLRRAFGGHLVQNVESEAAVALSGIIG